MVRGRPVKNSNVPCEDCVRRASTSKDIGLCDDCLATLGGARNHPNKPTTVTTRASHAPSSIEALPTKQATILDLLSSMNSPLSRATIESASSESREKTLRYLEQCSLEFGEAVNTRNWNHPCFNRAAPDMDAARLDRFAATDTLADHVATFQQIVAESPNYHMDVEEVMGILSDDGMTAEVFVTVKVTGRPENVTRHSLGKLKWEKRADTWICVSHIGMRSFEPAY